MCVTVACWLVDIRMKKGSKKVRPTGNCDTKEPLIRLEMPCIWTPGQKASTPRLDVESLDSDPSLDGADVDLSQL